MFEALPARRSTPWWAGVRAYPRTAAIVFVVSLLAGIAAAAVLPASYSSEATVLVGPLVSGNEDRTVRAEQLVNMDTEVEILKSESVLAAAADAVGTTSQTIGGSLEVGVVPGTQVAAVLVRASVPTAARERADAVVASYLDLRRANGEALLEERRARLEGQLKTLTDQIGAVSAERATAPEGSPQILLLDAQLDSLRQSLVSQRTALYEVEGSVVDPGRVIAPAGSGVNAVPSTEVIIAGAGVLGLLLAIGLTWLRLNREPRVRTAVQIDVRGVEARRVPTEGPLELPHVALLNRHVQAGGSVLVMPVDPGAWPPHDLARRLTGMLELNGAAGRGPVMAAASPLTIEGQRRLGLGDAVVLVARISQTPISDVDDSVATCLAASATVVATLLVPPEDEPIEVIRVLPAQVRAATDGDESERPRAS